MTTFVHRSLAVVSMLALVGGCGGAEGVASPSAPAPSIGPLEFADAVCEWQDELLAGVGNPDTGVDSEAWAALEDALESGDEAAITEAAEGVLVHLAAGQAWADQMAAYPGGEEGGDHLAALMEQIGQGVGGLRDGTIAGDADMVQAARDRIQAAYLDHFWQGLQALREPVSQAGGVEGTPCATDPIPET